MSQNFIHQNGIDSVLNLLSLPNMSPHNLELVNIKDLCDTINTRCGFAIHVNAMSKLNETFEHLDCLGMLGFNTSDSVLLDDLARWFCWCSSDNVKQVKTGHDIITPALQAASNAARFMHLISFPASFRTNLVIARLWSSKLGFDVLRQVGKLYMMLIKEKFIHEAFIQGHCFMNECIKSTRSLIVRLQCCCEAFLFNSVEVRSLVMKPSLIEC